MQDEWQAHPWLGTVLTASAAVAYSTAGYFTRLIELDIPTVLFWRGLYAGLFMSVCIVLLHGKETVASARNIGLPGLLAAVLSVWLAFAEAPPATTIAGGSIVFAATVAPSLFGRDVCQLETRSPIRKNEGPSNERHADLRGHPSRRTGDRGESRDRRSLGSL